MSSGAMVEITGLEDDPIVCTLASFIDNNLDGLTTEDVVSIMALCEGESFSGGGGASVAWTLKVIETP